MLSTVLQSKYPRLPSHREVLTIDKSPEPTGDELNQTLQLAERCHLVFEKGGVGPSKPSPPRGKAANGRQPVVSAPAEPGHRYSYHGDSPSSSSLSPTTAAGSNSNRHLLRLPRLAPAVSHRAAGGSDRRRQSSSERLPPLPPPYLFPRPATLRLRLARPAMPGCPGAELAGRCCRRWPPADVLTVLQRLPADRRRSCRQQLLHQLVADLRRRHEQSRGFSSACVMPPSAARAEAILSFLEPHLLPGPADGDQQPVWSWADWRGRVQRWAGWQPPEEVRDRSEDRPPPALWHRFIGRAAPDSTLEDVTGESAAAAAVDTTDRCELLKRDLIRSLTGLGEMLRRDGSSSSFYSIESDSLQERLELSETAARGRQAESPASDLQVEVEMSEEEARREAQAMMAAGVGRHSSSESEPGGGGAVGRSSGSSGSSGVERLAAEPLAAAVGPGTERLAPALGRRDSAESVGSTEERRPRPPAPPVQVRLEARCSFEPAAERQLQLVVAAHASCEASDDRPRPAAAPRPPSDQQSLPPAHRGDGAWDSRLERPPASTGMSSASSESEGSDNYVQLTARRVEECQQHARNAVFRAPTNDVPVSGTLNTPKEQSNLKRFSTFDHEQSLRMNVKDTWCNSNQFSLNSGRNWSAVYRQDASRQTEKQYEYLFREKLTGKRTVDDSSDRQVNSLPKADGSPSPVKCPSADLANLWHLTDSRSQAAPEPWSAVGDQVSQKPLGRGEMDPVGRPAAAAPDSAASSEALARPVSPPASDRGDATFVVMSRCDAGGDAELPAAATDEPPPPSPPPPPPTSSDIDRTCTEAGRRQTALRLPVHAGVDWPSGGDGCDRLTEPVRPPGDAAAAGVSEEDSGCSVGGEEGEARRIHSDRCSGSGTGSVHRPDAGRQGQVTVMHASLQPSIRQFPVPKPPPALASQWELDSISLAGAVASIQAPKPSDNGQRCAGDQSGFDTWSSPCGKEPSISGSQEEISLEEMLSDSVDSSILVAAEEDDDVASSPDEQAETEAALLSEKCQRVEDETTVLIDRCPRIAGEDAMLRKGYASGGSEAVTSNSKTPRAGGGVTVPINRCLRTGDEAAVLRSRYPRDSEDATFLRSRHRREGSEAALSRNRTTRAGGESGLLNSRCPRGAGEAAISSSRTPRAGSETGVSSSTSPSRIPRLCGPGRQPVSPSRLPVLGRHCAATRPAAVSPESPPEPRGLPPPKPTLACTLRGRTIRQSLAAAGRQSRGLAVGRYSAIHAGQPRRPPLPGPASSVPTLLLTGPQHNGNSYGGSDHLDRALRAPSKQSQYTSSADGHSESSDEDPNGITLSNSTRSKLKLLTKRNEMRKGLERGQQETEPPGHSIQDRNERSRKFRQLEKELSPGSVESRLAAARRTGQLAVRSVTGPGLRLTPQPADPLRVRRAVSHERPAAHGQQHVSSPEKRSHMLPSPRIERKSGSMQNLATHKPKQPTLPKSKTFGADLNKRPAPSSVTSVFGDHLERFANPRQALDEAYRKLGSDDWEREVSGLTDLVRLFRHHPEAVAGDLKTIMAAVAKQMKNLRSQVLRAAVQTSAEMFQHVGKAAEPNMEKIVAILLAKTSDTNKFIKADSNSALDVMLANVSVPRAIVAVTSEGLGHRNSQVRATVARLLEAVVRRLGAAGSLSGQRDVTERLVPAASQLVREGDLQTRIHAKAIFHVWLESPDLDKVLGKYLSSTVKRDIDKVLDNIRNEVPSAPSSASASLTLIS